MITEVKILIERSGKEIVKETYKNKWKMVYINTTFSVFTLNVSGINAPIKRQILAELIFNMIQLYAIHKQFILDSKTQIC